MIVHNIIRECQLFRSRQCVNGRPLRRIFCELGDNLTAKDAWGRIRYVIESANKLLCLPVAPVTIAEDMVECQHGVGISYAGPVRTYMQAVLR